MNKDKAGELLGKFWEKHPELVKLDENIYFIDTFIEWLYDEGNMIINPEELGKINGMTILADIHGQNPFKKEST